MGFILLIVFILTIFRAWKQSSLRTRQHGKKHTQTYSHHAHDAFFVYLHVYLHVFTSIFANVQKTHA